MIGLKYRDNLDLIDSDCLKLDLCDKNNLNIN